tara:strand:- start:1594 stop:1806 length:213 start_codon:yes stop_codon:yes gene_type:complete
MAKRIAQSPVFIEYIGIKLFIVQVLPIYVRCSIESFVNFSQNILHKNEICGFLAFRQRRKIVAGDVRSRS